ncbi:MAG: restriction endonuclease subunit S [Clostridiales bacterium]|nr:restriction endonuclease subunit S [Clostridiales bacterium]
MKDSGIKWIGEIPEDVALWRIKYLASFVKGKIPTSLNKDGVGMPYIGASEMNGRQPTQHTEDINIVRCDKNDVLILWDGANAGLIATSKEGAVSSTAVKLSVTSDSVNSLYLFYLLKYAEKYFRDKVNGTTIPHMNFEYIDDIPFLAFNYIDQQKIAAFLNDKCTKIDSLIAHEEATIEELESYKQSVITEAVTKGLDKSVPMKDSGIEWIGEIPAEWKVVRMKDLGRCRNGLTYSPNNLVSEDEGILVLRSSNIKNGKLSFSDNVFVNSEIKDELMVKAGDILICSRNGSRALIGKNALIPEKLKASFGAFMMIFRCKSPKYVQMILNSDVFSYYLGTFLTATINQLTADNFNNMKIVYCNDALEQEQITDYLEKKCAYIDNLVYIKQLKIEELKEYKKSLIYEYVTGKKWLNG